MIFVDGKSIFVVEMTTDRPPCVAFENKLQKKAIDLKLVGLRGRCSDSQVADLIFRSKMHCDYHKAGIFGRTAGCAEPTQERQTVHTYMYAGHACGDSSAVVNRRAM